VRPPRHVAADNINPDGSYPNIPQNYTDATGGGTYYVFTAGEGLSSATYQPLWVRRASLHATSMLPPAGAPALTELLPEAVLSPRRSGQRTILDAGHVSGHRASAILLHTSHLRASEPLSIT